ncbi:MAG: threonylcarbamoyl-AMP synthase [Candidimonas sp.]|nr:MAG: threonylcarbamoyl-AMP synthase [Candidimonas sp.]
MTELDGGRVTTIERAARRLAEGGLVAFPTETVYGLGADAENVQAVARIYAAKGRPANHPVIVHVTPEADLNYWASAIPEVARVLMDAFWPGPLTLILPRAPHIPPAVSGGQDSIGLRCPSHPVAQALLRAFAALKANGQGGVAAPSANKFGQVSPTRAEHVCSEFAAMSPAELLVLAGGPSEIGIESTIVDVSRTARGVGPVLLRPGHISAAQLADVLGEPVGRPDAAAPRVSGSLKAHYAPRTPLSLFDRDHLPRRLTRSGASGDAPGSRVAVMAFADLEKPPPTADVDWFTAPADPDAYARVLYDMLRRFDDGGYGHIFAQRPPVAPAWQAVNDRIGRAAAAFADDSLP